LPSKQSDAFSFLEEDDCHREREVIIGYKLVDKLTEYQESLLSYAWISDNFHKAKYLNDRMLEISNEKGILEGAFKCIGVTSFPQKKSYYPALRKTLLVKWQNCRDYYCNQAQRVVKNKLGE
jgi:hypothetical protein